MNTALMQSYLHNIGEWIIDEDKIVTYKWLSKVLKVHVNTAKQLLFAYLSEQKKKSPCKITATHLLAGELKDGSKGVSIVNEEDLVATRDNFKEITSEHVYSIQKSQYIKNLQLLYAVTKSVQDAEGFENPIKYNKNTLRSKSFCVLENAKEKTVSDGVEIRDSNKTEASKETNKKIISPKKENGNQGKESIKTKAHLGRKGINTGKDRNIANFFNNAGPTKGLKSPTDLRQKKEESECLKKVESFDDKDPVRKIKTNEDDQKDEIKMRASKPNVRPSKQKKEKKKEEREEKKRKRIKVFSDSEESNDESSEDNKISSPVKPDVCLPEDQIESKMENVDLEDEPTPQNKRKKRKIVDKLVVHDDGFMETKKEVVYESDSGNEEERHIKEKEDSPKRSSPRKKVKTINENSKTKPTSTTSAQQKKQSSLYSFFKKN